MIIVIARFALSSASRDRLLEMVRGMDMDTAHESGCVLYRHALDVFDPNRLILSEIWTDAAALQAHFCSPHFRAFRAAARQLGVRSEVVQFDGSEVAATDSHHWKRLLGAAGS
jgi:quinol monooxygenase YgiN